MSYSSVARSRITNCAKKKKSIDSDGKVYERGCSNALSYFTDFQSAIFYVVMHQANGMRCAMLCRMEAREVRRFTLVFSEL